MAGEAEFLRKKFSEFYARTYISEPPEPQCREFGIGDFGRKIVDRHLSFASAAELNSYLKKFAPFFISYSSALYKFPARRDMQGKELIGADLIYEFDADDIKTACKQNHDSWLCPKCGASGKGAIENCTECGTRVKQEQWFCPECLGEAKRRVFNLLDFLENDFGFSQGIVINFSGKAGYHVHVRNEAVRQLSRGARLEMLDYLTANGISILSHFEKRETYFVCKGLGLRSSWTKRIVSEILSLLEEGNAEKIAVKGNLKGSKGAAAILRSRKVIMDSIRKRNILPSVFGRASSGTMSQSDKFWESFIQSIISDIAPLDRQTSADMSKIVRVPGTLHGETGFRAAVVEREKLGGFNPFEDALAFDDAPTKVFINKAPSFYLGGKKLGPFSSEEQELPLFAAIYLLGRGAAEFKAKP
jgi:DNA primase small subunit